MAINPIGSGSQIPIKLSLPNST